MVNKKHIPEIYEKIKDWIPDQSRQSALVIDLTVTQAFKKNKPFRDFVRLLLDENAAQLRKES